MYYSSVTSNVRRAQQTHLLYDAYVRFEKLTVPMIGVYHVSR